MKRQATYWEKSVCVCVCQMCVLHPDCVKNSLTYSVKAQELKKKTDWGGGVVLPQWLGIHNARDIGSIPGSGTKIPHAEATKLEHHN